MTIIILFPCLLLLIEQGICQGSIYTANQKYSYTGKRVIDVAYETQRAGTSNWGQIPVNITIPYPTNIKFNNPKELTVMVVFGDLLYAKFQARINVKTILINKTETYFQVLLVSGLAKYFQKLSLTYLVIYKGSYVDDWRNFNIKYNNKGMGYNFSNNSLPSTHIIQLSMQEMNFTGGAVSVGFISGMSLHIYSIQRKVLQLLLQTEVIKSTLIYIKISSPSRAVFLNTIFMSIIVFNRGFSNSNDFHLRFQSGNIKFYSLSSFVYTNTDYKMNSFNTFVGLSGFKVSQQNTFSFFTQFNFPHSVSISSNNYFDYIVFKFIVVTSKYCDYKQPYFQEESQLCYSHCPQMTTADKDALACLCYINGSLTDNANCTTNFVEGDLFNLQIIVICAGIMIITFLLLICVKRGNLLRQLRRQFAEQKEDAAQQSEKDLTHKEGIQLSQMRQEQSDSYKWMKAEKPNKSEAICSICSQRRALFKNSCQHNFHISCILKLQVDKKVCPDCHENIRNEGRVYCTICNKSYRIVQLRGDRIERSSLQIYCDQCNNVSL